MNVQDIELAARTARFRAQFDGSHATLPITPAELACRGEEIEARAWEDFYEAAPGNVRSTLGVSHERVGSVTLLMAPGMDSLLFNRAIGLGMTTPTSAVGVECIAKAFGAAGVTRWWLQVNSFASPGNLACSLESAGWRRAPRSSCAKMVRKTGAIESGATTLRVESATIATLASIVDAITQGLSMPSIFATWLRALHGRERWRVYGLFDGDTPVGGGVLFVEDAYAWMGISGVVESHRRRGGHRALMARRAYDARRFGADWIATEAAEAPDGINPSMQSLRRCDFDLIAARRKLTPPVPVNELCKAAV
jgi:GNAT superfamily N-acetyltransferase